MSKFVELIKTAAIEALRQLHPCDVLFGTVIQEEPLIIETDDKIPLTEYFLVLAEDVTDHQTWISFDDETIKQRIKLYDRPEDEPFNKPTIPPPEEQITDIQFIYTDYREGHNIDNKKAGKQPTKHPITIYKHLRLKDRVILIRQQGGQKYIVVDRIGVFGNDS